MWLKILHIFISEKRVSSWIQISYKWIFSNLKFCFPFIKQVLHFLFIMNKFFATWFYICFNERGHFLVNLKVFLTWIFWKNLFQKTFFSTFRVAQIFVLLEMFYRWNILRVLLIILVLYNLMFLHSIFELKFLRWNFIVYIHDLAWNFAQLKMFY